MKLTKIFITLSVVAGLVFSCNRDETTTTDTTTAKENVETEATADKVTDTNVDLAMDFATTFEDTFSLKSGGHHPDYPCATVTVTSNNGAFPKTITVDFGTGCTDPRGITRKGKIIMTVTNKLFIPGASITVTEDNFYVNNNKVEGEMVLTNTTTDLATPSFSKVITNGKITREDASYFTFTSSRKWKMVEGVSTPKYIWDDVWEIFEGNQNINRSNGTYFTSTIKTSLIKKNTCHFISKGSIYMKGTKIDGTLDFGNGDCDNTATFTDANGNVTTITLK